MKNIINLTFLFFLISHIYVFANEIKNPDIVISFSELGSDITAWAISPDEKFIAVADKKIYIKDKESNKVVTILDGHEDTISALCYSHSGKWIASANLKSHIKIWDIASGSLLTEFWGILKDNKSPEKHTIDLIFSIDNSKLVAAHIGSSIQVMDVATGEELFNTNYTFTRYLQISKPTNIVLASAFTDTITIDLDHGFDVMKFSGTSVFNIQGDNLFCLKENEEKQGVQVNKKSLNDKVTEWKSLSFVMHSFNLIISPRNPDILAAYFEKKVNPWAVYVIPYNKTIFLSETTKGWARGHLRFSADGKFIICSSGKDIHFYDMDNIFSTAKSSEAY